MPQRPIDGVRVKQLKAIPDERGRLTEMLRRDYEIFIEFAMRHQPRMTR